LYLPARLRVANAWLAQSAGRCLGGIEQIDSGGTAIGTTVRTGGIEQVFGGTAIGTILQGGGEGVGSGGTASDTVVSSGEEDVFGSGTAIGTILRGGLGSSSAAAPRSAP